jgi:broad specificity phosphatase PhoE
MSNKLEKKYQITLLRHGESVGNAQGYHQGQSEFPLTSNGQAQANALGEWWLSKRTGFDLIISSPQSRARQTARIIAGILGIRIEYDEMWMERDNGVYAGLHIDEARIKYPRPETISLYERIGKTGESDWELYLRGGQAIQSVLHRNPGRYLVVSHGGILNKTLHAIFGMSPQTNFQGIRFRFRNTAFATLTYNQERHVWYVNGINDRPHWEDSDDS